MWLPDPIRSKTTRWRTLVNRIEDAIWQGELAPGDRLASQRALAHHLGWSAATAVRAYEELVRRGLVERQVGRGTFVRAVASRHHRRGGTAIDLASNIAPFPESLEAKELLSSTLESLTFLHEPARLLSADRVREAESTRVSGAKWLARCGLSTPADRTELVCGSQHGLSVALAATCNSGDSIASAALSNPGLLAAAAHYGLHLEPLPHDHEGLLPDAVERLCRRRSIKVLYCAPNAQNPTAATLPETRRQEIARIAARHGLIVIEDDEYGPIVANRPPPLAALIPDRVLYLGSLSKCFGFGLRLGYAAVPEALSARFRDGLRSTVWMASPLLAEIASAWIDDGTADRFVTLRRREGSRRLRLAGRVLALGRPDLPAEGYHIWLSLPGTWSSRRLVSAAAKRGVLVSPASEFQLSAGTPPRAVRLALGAPNTMAELRTGLETIARLIGQRDDAP